MSVEQLQQRLADLKFSLEMTVKELVEGQKTSENEHAEWEAAEDEEVPEPDVIDNDDKIDALEKARDHLDEAIEALDDAMED